MKDILFKMLVFFACCFAFLGAVGGFGYLMYYKQIHIAIGIVVLAVLAFPKFKQLLKNFTETGSSKK